MIKIKKGLTIPLKGAPNQFIDTASAPSQVAILGVDYVGMKPTMLVKEGDQVKLGQPLFSDKKNPQVIYTSPASGQVKAIHRGEKRALQSVVIACEGNDAIEFSAYPEAELAQLSPEQVTENLLASGLWTTLRTRPYSKVPEPEGERPAAVFINAMDTHPLAADPAMVIADAPEAFSAGVTVLSRLTQGTTYVCTAPGFRPALGPAASVSGEEFSGPHPAGLVGTHIHSLAPASNQRTVWHINYQDVIAVGRLFLTGRLDPSRVISLAGPSVLKPRLLRTQIGARLSELCEGELDPGTEEVRVISGSVLSGRKAAGYLDYLGRYHLQVSVLPEGYEREALPFARPGSDRFSVFNIFASRLQSSKLFNMTTTTYGSERAMVPVGTYEAVMPLDILPTHLLRALIVGDTDNAQALGCLELDEEDLALCTFVCPGKYEYGPILRDNLTRIEKEG